MKMFFCNFYPYEIYTGTFVRQNGKVWLQSIVTCKKCSLEKVANFYIFLYCRGKFYHAYLAQKFFFRAKYKRIKFVKFCGAVFLHLQHFAIKLCSFSKFNMFFSAVVIKFVVLAWIKSSLCRKIFIDPVYSKVD